MNFFPKTGLTVSPILLSMNTEVRTSGFIVNITGAKLYNKAYNG